MYKVGSMMICWMENLFLQAAETEHCIAGSAHVRGTNQQEQHLHGTSLLNGTDAAANEVHSNSPTG
jgi:hypothetical protein